MSYTGQFFERLGSLGVNTLLGPLGLERRRSMADAFVRGTLIFSGGVMTGAILGILFAPASGTETRAWISRRSRNIAEQGLHALRSVRGKGNGAAAGVEARVAPKDGNASAGV